MSDGPRGRRPAAWAAVLAVSFLAALAAGGWLVTRPESTFLRPHAGATWVRVDRPILLQERVAPRTVTAFFTTFTAPANLAGGVIRVRAMRGFVAKVDGVVVFDTGGVVDDWQTVRAVPLPAGLAVGHHRLRLEVVDVAGPAVVWARCDAVGLRTGAAGWQGAEVPTTGAAGWQRVVPADEPWALPVSAAFAPAGASVAARLPWLAAVFAAGAGVYLYQTRSARGTGGRRWDVGRAVRWAVVAAWVVLGWHNLPRLPEYVGYDVRHHLEYVRWVAEHGGIPRPTQGWEFFHPPAYYWLSAVAYRLLLAAGCGVERAAELLRLVPLACGAAMVELCYRAARHVAPGRPAAAAVAAVVGGLLPMNLYMGQSVSNEPLAACLAGGTGVVAMGLLAAGPSVGGWTARRWRTTLLLLGVGLGLAALTKVTALLWAGPVAAAAGVCVTRRVGGWSSRRRAGVAAGAVVLGVAVAVSGWYFVRTRVVTGRFVWATAHGAYGRSWWQEPGYRTPADFLRFGRVFDRPVFGVCPGVWDTLYGTLWGDGLLNGVIDADHRPPFDYGWIACGVWLGGPLTVLGIVGLGRAVAGGSAPIRFAAVMVAVNLTALLLICLQVPVYSTAKASYGLAATPCLAVLIVAGYETVARTRFARAACVGLLACYACAAVLGYYAEG